ncbi:hypothetical protein ACJJTC_002716 [Scirpophaga incertulas]
MSDCIPGKRPFVCPEPGCNKAYAQVTNLNQHRKRHLNGRPVESTYDCTVCGEQFHQRNHMYTHRLISPDAKLTAKRGLRPCGSRAATAARRFPRSGSCARTPRRTWTPPLRTAAVSVLAPPADCVARSGSCARTPRRTWTPPLRTAALGGGSCARTPRRTWTPPLRTAAVSVLAPPADCVARSGSCARTPASHVDTATADGSGQCASPPADCVARSGSCGAHPASHGDTATADGSGQCTSPPADCVARSGSCARTPRRTWTPPLRTAAVSVLAPQLIV